MRRFLSILLISFTTLTATAQVGNLRNTLSVGFSGGMGTSSVSFIPSIKQQLSLGPTFGVSLRHISEKYFFLICGTQLEGDQPWDFFGRNDATAETPVLWPPHGKS